MTSINWRLKEVLVHMYGSQVEAAKAMGIRENRLSYIVRGHIQPSRREREALEQTLGKIKVKFLLSSHPRKAPNPNNAYSGEG